MEWESYLNDLFNTRTKEEAIHYLQQHPEEIELLIAFASEKDEKLAWRSAWILDHLTLAASNLINPHLPALVKTVVNTPFDGVKRSLVKILATTSTSVNENGRLVNLCFKWIVDRGTPTAVRVHAMQLVFDLMPKYPDLKGELKASLEQAAGEEGKGLKNRAEKLLEKLE